MFEWIAEAKPPADPPRTHLTVLAPVNASASSDAGILTALLRIGETLGVRAGDGTLVRYVVVVVDRAIFARVWRLITHSKEEPETNFRPSHAARGAR